ncbi:ABC transporter ATP-binding protein [Pseudorhodobacter sp. E13]|uniref:ABC transporter ATP-binding protein n=1 Tax=Pseudorhodobacter sp. E13 TaxID=2487931 RepID=UPI000F8D4DB3|nr:ABC transporter ATP-binding protein [Pseudorhodobacter sp. E13]RUS65135.1 ABC transporter ATP-binding protein [Pseudorhodobacter sp. E13]
MNTTNRRFNLFRRATADSLLWRLLTESLPEHKGKYAAAIAAMVLVASTTALSAWVMGEIVDAMTDAENKRRIYWVATSVFLIFTAKGFASFAQTVLMARAGNRIVAEKQTSLFKRLLGQGIAFFNTTESSDLLLRVTQSAQMARNVIDVVVTGFVRDLLTLIGLVAVMFYQQPFLSLISLVVGPAAVLGVRMILTKVRAIMAQEMAGLAEIIKVVQETSTGARVIKAFALEEVMQRRMASAVRDVEKRSNKMVRLESATSPLMDTLTGAAIAAIVLLSSTSFAGQSVGTPGQLMSFVTAFLMAYEPAKRLSRMRVTIEAGMVGVRMMYDLLDMPLTLTEAPDAQKLTVGPGKVTLNNVSFGYANGAPVIHDLDLTFEAGQTTALVGPSGGGKSTILNLLLRLYDPSEGVVCIDGSDIRQATFASLREKIAFVGQDTFLFSNTVMENLRVARPNATDEEVFDAARVAHAHDFIEALPGGYQTHIGENGAFLSGGQRQRLSITRAVLRHAPILLLDEATSALDSQSEAYIRDALARVSAGVTTIVIAHRLATVLEADKICYIEAGEVKEQGTLQELLAKGGKFKKLYETQFQNG